MAIQDLYTKVLQRFATKAKCTLLNDQITIEVSTTDILDVCLTLHNDNEFKFEQLIDLCGVDYLNYGIGEWTTNTATKLGFSRAVDKYGNNKFHCGNHQIPARFAVVYHLLSVTLNQRIRIKVFLQNEMLAIPSVINIWNSADWYEREAFDLYGILFTGHPDLRRILTDYGFIGHPFRKDFPLIGQVEMRYDAGEGRVVYEPVSIEARTLVPKVVRYTGDVAKAEGKD